MLLGVALVDVLSASGIEINSELSPKALIETNLSYLVNIQRSQARPLDGDERIRQLTLMTNMMQSAIRTNAFSHVEWYDRLSLIGWSLGLPAVRSDEGALVYCANLELL